MKNWKKLFVSIWKINLKNPRLLNLPYHISFEQEIYFDIH